MKPIKLLRSFLAGKNLKPIFLNIFWLLSDKILRMGVGVFVGVWIARYLGPSQYGLWNFSISFSALFSVLGTLSIDNIVVKELLEKPSNTHTILGTSWILRLIGGIVGLIISVITVHFLRPGNIQILLLVALSSSGYVFQSVYVIDFYYQAHLKSKFSVYAQNAAFIITTIIKVVLLIQHASLMGFAVVSAFEFVFAGAFMIFLYHKKEFSIVSWKFDKQIAKNLLGNSYPLILSGVAIMIYMRLDQVMLGQMLSDKAVGVYSAAIRISEVWYFIPMSIGSSIFPLIIGLKAKGEEKYYSSLQSGYDFMALLGITVGIFFTFYSSFIINTLYGKQYAEAANVLTVTIWTGVMVCLSTIHSRWLILENLQKYSLLYTVVGALTNFLANLYLIKHFGIIGAAMGTLVAQFTPLFCALFIFKVRRNILMMFNAFLFPLRIYKLFKYINGNKNY